ncbi:Smr/MutS family protein [Maricaulis sp. CAU 1757]
MARKRHISPEEKALWRKVARSVKPISEDRLRTLEDDFEAPPLPPAQTKSELKGTPAMPKPAPAAPPAPPRPADRSGEKRVRRGRLEIEARIDLHGLTRAQAHASLTHFLAMAWGAGYRTVLVITGKGLKPRERQPEPWEHADEPGVLRRELPLWLGAPEFARYVSGYAPAHQRHGGGGAYYVTLRARAVE